MKWIGKTGIGMMFSLGLVAITTADAAAQAPIIEPAADEPTITIDLSGGAVEGEAVLSPEEDRTDVEIALSGAASEADLVGVLVSGKCSEGGEVIAQLGPIEVNESGEGELSAELPIALETIAAAPVAVEVRASAEPESTAIACGQHIAVAADETSEPAAEVSSEPLPLPAQPTDAAAPVPTVPEPRPEPAQDPLPAPMPERQQ